MGEMSPINWHNLEVRYINKHGNVFRIEEDNGRYMWSTDMITPLGDLYEAIQSRRHSSDSSMG